MRKIFLFGLFLLMMVLMQGCDKGQGYMPDGDEEYEVVEEPAEEDIATVGDGNTKVHTLVSYCHKFYNKTICYNGYKNADGKEQRLMAEEILEMLEEVSTENDNLSKDIIEAKKVMEYIIDNSSEHSVELEKQYIRAHRLFHDLDIYLNGYDYKKAWGVTSYKGK